MLGLSQLQAFAVYASSLLPLLPLSALPLLSLLRHIKWQSCLIFPGPPGLLSFWAGEVGGKAEPGSPSDLLEHGKRSDHVPKTAAGIAPKSHLSSLVERQEPNFCEALTNWGLAELQASGAPATATLTTHTLSCSSQMFLL